MAAIQIKVRRPIGSLQNLVLKSHAFRIFFGKPSLRDFSVREHLDVLGIADLFAGFDIDKNGHWSYPVRKFLPRIDTSLNMPFGSAPSGQARRMSSGPVVRRAD